MAESNNTPALPQNLASLELGNVVQIPAVRQVLLLCGVAAAVALGVAAFLWAQTPDMRPVYTALDAGDASEVVSALNAAGIDNRLDAGGTRVLVPAAEVETARLELAGQGLPAATSIGAEMLKEQPGFGVSQFMESARYQHALETELARTIRHLASVADARVHLAIPRQTGFLRDRNRPSASVMVSLHQGRMLEPGQTESIVHLVASSIANLSSDAVTVIDQRGRLLTRNGEPLGASSAQLSYTRDLEERYRRRIVELLTPLTGVGRVRAEVAADLDFTQVEETRESFDPDANAIRSESVSEEQRAASAGEAAGIPGALSNQPPETGGVRTAEATGGVAEPLNRSSAATRNFELDKTVSVVRQPVGSVRRLSVAVLLDESEAVASGDDAPPAEPLDDATIERYTALVREAVGFNAARGDTVSVISAPFRAEPDPPELEAPAIWQRPGIQALARNVIGILVVLGIAFGLGRPLLRGLLETTSRPAVNVTASTGELLPAGTTGGGMIVPAPAQYTYDQKVAAARNITNHDPDRVATVVRKWVNEDE